ncbi:MAG TPA: ABC transporter substrate-binding protein [Candidatus Acidoferrales bacterium]|nr:ABC transporter substrate-binding protein [Candidatus Acidoferrales bacterium]
MNSRRLRAFTATVFFICLFLSVTARAAAPLETVRIATPGKLIDFAALYAGAQLGIYRQEGLDPQFIVMRSGIIIQALTSGEIDYTTLLSSSVRAAVAGLPVRVLMGLILKQTFFLLSQPEIRDVKQLKGKRIAVANFGSATDKSARTALERAGLDPNRDAIILALGDTGLRYAALQARTIEAAVLSPPYNFSAQRQGFNNLVWLGELLGDNPSNGLATITKKLKEQPDQVYRMLRATVRSMIYTREHAREVLPILMKDFKGWDNDTISQALEFIIKGMSRDGTFSEAVLRDSVNEEKSRLNVKKEIPLNQVADFEPLYRVVREIAK